MDDEEWGIDNYKLWMGNEELRMENDKCGIKNVWLSHEVFRLAQYNPKSKYRKESLNSTVNKQVQGRL